MRSGADGDAVCGGVEMDAVVKYFPAVLAGLEILAGFHCFTRFIGRRAKAAHYLLCLAVVGIPMWVLEGKGGAQILLFGISLAAAGLFYGAACGKSLLYSVVTVELLQVCFGIFDSISSLLFPVFYPLCPAAGAWFMVLGGLMALLLFSLCGQITRRHFLDAGEENGRGSVLLPLVPMLLLVLVGRYISAEIYGNTVSVLPGSSLPGTADLLLLAMQILGVASLFCILYADKRAAEGFRLRMECALLEQEARSMERYVEEAGLRCERTAAFRHDARNHLAVVRELVRREKYGEALAYLEETEEVRAQADFPCATGNPVLDILLGSKLGVAAELGIRASCTLKLPCPCGVSNIDFGIVLSNALDNAIRACRDVEGRERFIDVRGRAQGELFLVEVENSCSGAARIVEGRGIANIRAVAEKYQGSLELERREKTVRLSVLLVVRAANVSKEDGL
ncbi:MAG: ATP-binding protein [bacterium]|nr:ATP-binding protein [bacterium]MCM1375804.1 ATP-binding protein [Muribaculum sp.]